MESEILITLYSLLLRTSLQQSCVFKGDIPEFTRHTPEVDDVNSVQCRQLLNISFHQLPGAKWKLRSRIDPEVIVGSIRAGTLRA